MAAKLKWVAIAATALLGLWLAFHNGIEGGIPSAHNCAAAKMIFCIQKVR